MFNVGTNREDVGAKIGAFYETMSGPLDPPAIFSRNFSLPLIEPLPDIGLRQTKSSSEIALRSENLYGELKGIFHGSHNKPYSLKNQSLGC